MLKWLIKSLVGLAAVSVASSATAQSIEDREMRQEAQIDRAETAGQLTSSQAVQLRSAEQHLLQVEARMRWQYGGDLSQSQRRALNSLADQDSATINQMTREAARHGVRSQ